jgi:hypothetical protein
MQRERQRELAQSYMALIGSKEAEERKRNAQSRSFFDWAQGFSFFVSITFQNPPTFSSLLLLLQAPFPFFFFFLFQLIPANKCKTCCFRAASECVVTVPSVFLIRSAITSLPKLLKCIGLFFFFFFF